MSVKKQWLKKNNFMFIPQLGRDSSSSNTAQASSLLPKLFMRFQTRSESHRLHVFCTQWQDKKRDLILAN